MYNMEFDLLDINDPRSLKFEKKRIKEMGWDTEEAMRDVYSDVLSKRGKPIKKSKTLKQAKELYEEMSKPTIKKRVSTKKGTKLLKQVQSLATEQEGNKLIHQLESKLKKHTTDKDISDIQKMIDQVKSINVTKHKKPSKNISKVIEIAQMISKAPKHKKSDIDTESKIVHESFSKIDKFLDKPKPLVKMPKVMQQAKGYEHKVYDVSERVQNYVDQYKDIINTGGNKGAITRAINQLKLKVMTNMKPSEVDDANKMISDFRKTLPPPVTQAKVTKVKAPKPDDGSYEGDKKYKPLTAYVKKHKPTITDPEDIHIIVVDLIDKKIPRMSVKKLNEVLEDLGY